MTRAGHSRPFRSIMVCVDFSDESIRALASAASLAQDDQSMLHVVHCKTDALNLWHRRFPRLRDKVQGDSVDRATKSLEKCLEQIQPKTNGLGVQLHVIENQSAGLGLTEKAKQLDADLIVVGNRGATNLRYVLLGSTAERMLLQLPSSILAVKPKDMSSLVLQNG